MPTTADLTALAETCLGHLADEEAALSEVHLTLTGLRSALLSGGREELRQAAAAHAAASQHSSQLNARRVRLQGQLAEGLGLPVQDACVSALRERVGEGHAERLAESQRRIAEVAERVADAAKTSASLLAYCRTFFDDVWAEVESPKSNVVRYGPTGAQRPANPATTVLTQG